MFGRREALLSQQDNIWGYAGRKHERYSEEHIYSRERFYDATTSKWLSPILKA